MRSAPFGLRARSARHAFDLAVECAQITHGHPTGYLAAGAFAALVHFLMEDEIRRGAEPLAQAVRKAMDLLATYPSHEETTQALHAAVSLSATGDPSPEKVGSLGEAWVAEEALAIAVYCALVHPEPGDFQRALLLSVNHSGDSDSTGAVCGNLLGAYTARPHSPPSGSPTSKGATSSSSSPTTSRRSRSTGTRSPRRGCGGIPAPEPGGLRAGLRIHRRRNRWSATRIAFSTQKGR